MHVNLGIPGKRTHTDRYMHVYTCMILATNEQCQVEMEFYSNSSP